MNNWKRRDFIKTAVAGSAVIGAGFKPLTKGVKGMQKNGRIGIIGLDTSHAIAFTKALNDPAVSDTYGGFRIVAAYPKGSSDIKSSADRIPAYTKEVETYGVSIVNSIEELLKTVDFVLLETNDGRLHLEQSLKVLKAGKTMFIDKPVSASLPDAIAIYRAAEHYKVPVFSSSSLRYITGVKEIAEGSIGKVLGADTFSPCTLEKTHPDLFWYGIHGVETLFTIMGTGCKTVTRSSAESFEKVTGIWNDGRIGSFRGIRSGKSDYGGTVFGEKGIAVLGKYAGYNPLLEKIIGFFQSGIPPVKAEETLEIFTFMEAAQESKIKGGVPVETGKLFEKAEKKADGIKII